MNYLKYLFAVSLLSFIALPATGYASSIEKPKKLVFSMITGAPEQRNVGKLLKKAYANIGIPIEFMELPGRRALEFSNSGKTDGEIFRIGSVVKKFVNLHRIETPVMSFRGFAYSTKNLKIDLWGDLKPYRVGIIRGNVWAEKNVEGRVIKRFDDLEQLVERLLMGGVDIIIESQRSTEEELKRISPETRIYRSKMLTEFSVYHYLNSKHKNLISLVETEIKKLLEKEKKFPSG